MSVYLAGKTKSGILPMSMDRNGTIHMLRNSGNWLPDGFWAGIDREASIEILETQPEGGLARSLKWLVPNGEPLAEWIVKSTQGENNV